MANVFDRFVTSDRKVKIASLGEEVTIRELTVAERKRVDAVLTADSTRDEKGKVIFSPTSYQNSQLLAVSLGLVEPKMSIKDLEKLSSSAFEAITEIYEEILNADESKVKKK